METELRKAILVADGDELLRGNIRSILEERGHLVTEASCGKRAKTLLSEAHFDLVISSAILPEVDGLQLLEFAKLQTKSRFILKTSDPQVLRDVQAFKMGADDFLPEQFNRNELLMALENSLNGDANRKKTTLDEDFVQVPIEEFITGSILKVDLHLRLGKDKYIKIGARHAFLDVEQIQKYMKKGIRFLHMVRQDFASYVGFNITISNAAHHEQKIETARKLRLTKHLTENLMAQLVTDGVGRQQLENASNVVLNTMELVTENPETLKLLQDMEVTGSLSSHSVAVGVWACLIAKKLNWSGQTTYFKIALSALFHDIGLKELPPHLHLKRRFELTAEESKQLESHAHRGRDILASVANLPEDVSIVALQHHELYHGGGYPHGLKLEQIHPIARLIAIADQLCEFLRQTTGSEEFKLRAAYEAFSANRRDYDNSYLKALGEIINSSKSNAA